MKQKLLFLFAALLSLPALAWKSTPAWSIVKTTHDNALKNTEAVFVFDFVTDNSGARNNPGGTQLWEWDTTAHAVGSIQPVHGVVQLIINDENKSFQPDSAGKVELHVSPGKFKFNCLYSPGIYTSVYIDSIRIKPANRVEVRVVFRRSEIEAVTFKPVIYLYPKARTDVKVTLDVKGSLGFTYPAYDKGWNVTADPDGTLQQGEKKYKYLFWDGVLNIPYAAVKWNEGFVVSRENLVPFFERTLAQMGLQPNEINDYITFWVPLMKVNETNYIHFLFNEDYNTYAALNITPKPDKQFRVYMMWTCGDSIEARSLSPQTIPSFQREGFSVVEWGGANLHLETIQRNAE